MSIEISAEVEQRLTNEAQRLGISVDELLKRCINEQALLAQPARPHAELPIWHLGGAGALHRRDIYDDAS